jgi:predicted glycosyltransferase
MRDIEDDPQTTLQEWAEWDVPRLHAEVYDRILYYGDPSVFDPVAAYGMSSNVAARLVACGYLGRSLDEVERPVAHVRRELGLADQPLVVVTVGGGGDGFALLRAVIEAVTNWPGGAPFHALLVTGPLMAAGKRQLLRQAQSASDRLTVLEFTPRLFTYMAAADLIVGMAGYNTVVETLSLGKRSILIPRTRPRQEQLIRAERLAARGWARLLVPDDLAPDTLAAQISLALASPAPRITVAMDGLTRVGASMAELFEFEPQIAVA